MAMINLLPWREKRRQQLKQEFFQQTGVIAGIALAICLIWHLAAQGMIDNQMSRNEMITGEIKALEKKVKEIEELKAQREEMIERMGVIQDLQGSRPQIVYIVDDVVRQIPKGVFLYRIERKENQVFFEGTAESISRVSTFMRNLANSEQFDRPNLTKVLANPEEGKQANDFILHVEVKKINNDREDDNG